MLSTLLSGFLSYSRLSGSLDDDWVDRLSHLYTVLILVIFALFTTTAHLVGKPIECWFPTEFSSAWEEYARHYCWVSNTYYIPMSDVIPTNHVHRREAELNYYQWVPTILLFQALFYKLPSVFWRMLSGSSGINLYKIMSLTETTQVGDPDARNETLKHIAIYIDRWLKLHQEYHSNKHIIRIQRTMARCFCFCVGKRYGSYLTGFYMFIKLFYVLNSVAQFLLLNIFLGNFFTLYGLEIVKNLINGEERIECKRFPRVTLCDFDIRQLRNIQRFTVQCVLPINLFNEKIFTFLWFWFVVVAAVTTTNFLFWIYRILVRATHYAYVKKYLNNYHLINTNKEKHWCRQFSEEYLRSDGIFVLRLVRKNSNEIILTDLIQHMWTIYRGQKTEAYHKEMDSESDSSNNKQYMCNNKT